MLTKAEKKLWTDALRSGEYKRGQGLLVRQYSGCTYESFCCLGVACVVFGVPREGMAFEGCASFLPDSLVDKMGMSNNGDVNSGVFLPGAEKALGFHSLTDANDKGKTFQEIADFLDAYLITSD